MTGGPPDHVADDASWDAPFTGHPLTLVRSDAARSGERAARGPSVIAA
ncbi:MULTISPECIES: hypothetical protein [Streptomyces]|nr:hypothetical protein [Streptomyces sp. CL12-4]MCG8969835.1 hypothetical protein [Streptomyces sp. CL12-4]